MRTPTCAPSRSKGSLGSAAADACRCLELNLSGGTHGHLRKLDADEKLLITRDLLSKRHVLGADLMGPNEPKLNAVSESGLYRLIMRADGSKAKPFQDWIVKEVLPAIRKTGGYLLNEEARENAHADTKQEMPLPEDCFC